MSHTPDPDWDPQDPAVLRDQRAAYDVMREQCPVAHSEFLGWSLFRHGDVTDVLADPATYSSASRHLAVPNGMDPPEHGAFRGVLEPYFTPEWIEAFEPTCRRIASGLVAALPRQTDIEFVDAFAEPFSLQAACAFLGWPLEGWQDLSGWTHGNQEAALSRDREAGARLARELAGYVSEQLQVRREAGSPASDDVTSSLMATEVNGALLSDEQIVSILRNWIAGHGTVVAGLSLLALFLATHADQQDPLRADPTLLPAAIDEILRADGPLVANRRTTTRPVEIGGRQIPANEKLTLIWIAANRDERVFADPDTVRFDRDPAANLLFGAGIHDCVGAPLARLEMRLALEELLAATTRITLDETIPVERGVYPGNGLARLPLVLH